MGEYDGLMDRVVEMVVQQIDPAPIIGMLPGPMVVELQAAVMKHINEHPEPDIPIDDRIHSAMCGFILSMICAYVPSKLDDDDKLRKLLDF